jgi:hypothetical protein
LVYKGLHTTGVVPAARAPSPRWREAIVIWSAEVCSFTDTLKALLGIEIKNGSRRKKTSKLRKKNQRAAFG